MNIIYFIYQTQILVHLTKNNRLSKYYIKNLLKNNGLVNIHDFYINNQKTDYVNIYNHQKIYISDEIINFDNFDNLDINKINTNDNKQISVIIFGILFFLFFIGMLFITIYFDLFLFQQILSWLFSIIGFLFFSYNYVNQENRNIIEEKNLELLKANDMKTMFIANLSHELKTPLSNIYGFCEMIKYKINENKNRNENGSDEINSIQNTVSYLLSMINNILLISKLKYDNITLNLEYIDFTNFINNIYDLIKVRLKDKNMTFTINDLEPKNFHLNIKKILIDVEKLTRVFINIITNSIKYSPANSNIKMIINYKILKNKIKLNVNIIDEGVGIDSKHLSEIFEPFYQVDVSNTRNFEGTGLGLPISNRLISKMNGNIILSSEINKGTNMGFYIITDIKQEDNEEDIKQEDNIIIPIHQEKEILIQDEKNDNIDYYNELKKMDIIHLKIEDQNLLLLFNLFLQEFDNIKINENTNTKYEIIIESKNKDEIYLTNLVDNITIQLPLTQEIIYKSIYCLL